jgi:hypothetical protein
MAGPVMAQTQGLKSMVVDGVQLEYLDLGQGKHTLVIESGIGQGVSYWQPLVADLAQLAIRIIIYSRAGNGQSQAHADVSLASSNARLAKLLTSLGAQKNLLLVGHSYGGLHVRTFAATYRNSVKGLLLLDPSHERFDSELFGYDAKWAKKDQAKLDSLMQGQPEWQHFQDIYRKKMIHDQDIANKLPTVILTSSKLNESDWWIGHSVAGKQIWRQLHQSLIRDNPNAMQLVTSQVGHHLPLENKTLLFNAINSLLLLTEMHQAKPE